MGSNDLPEMAIGRCYDHPRSFECLASLGRVRQDRRSHSERPIEEATDPRNILLRVRIGPDVYRVNADGRQAFRPQRRHGVRVP